MKKEFILTAREANLLDRVADATKMDDWFYIEEDPNTGGYIATDEEGISTSSAEVVSSLEDGLAYDLTEEQSGGFTPEEAKEVEAVFHRARYAQCDWRKFTALVYVEGSVNELPTYTIQGLIEEGIFIELDGAPSDFVMLRVIHHSEESCFPSVFTSNPNKGNINFFGTAMLIKSQLPAGVRDALREGKRLMVSYNYDEEDDNGVGYEGHLFPVWSVE